MKLDFINAILANTDKQLAKSSITGELRAMLEAQRIRLVEELQRQMITSWENAKTKPVSPRKVAKRVKSRIKTKKKK